MEHTPAPLLIEGKSTGIADKGRNEVSGGLQDSEKQL